jgi:hypothetical protein
VANVANRQTGARIGGIVVGREVCVEARNISAAMVELGQPLWAVAGRRTFRFDRYKYMLDFSGFASLLKYWSDHACQHSRAIRDAIYRGRSGAGREPSQPEMPDAGQGGHAGLAALRQLAVTTAL